jgi:serine/threonine protein kinase
MQKPGHKVDLSKAEAEVRLTTGLDEPTQPEFRAKVEGEATTQQELRVSTQTDMEVGLDEGFHSDRMLDSGTETHTGTSTHSEAQSETRHKTQSGELSHLERHADPDGTIGCNTCQEDLIEAISDQCKINVGDIIASRYEIKTYLGEGGMSAVYAAVDKVIKRDVALKILHRDLLVRGRGSLLRFQREAQALGNLDHPNIVKIHHFDADENAQPYIVMDIVQGESLARRLVKDPESVRFSDIIDIFVQVCDALSHAHTRGVVHRDLKPSNIMVVGNQVKVLDFGIAKLMSEDSDQELQLTRTGEVFGSPLYMSPEQCRGLKLDYRSDIYSLGCVMYEAFTGNPPFTGNSHIDTMLKHVNDLPASVVSSMCDARYVEKVDAILLRCMAKNPNARFQSMDEVKAALLELDRETKGPIEKFKQKVELIKLKLGAQGKLTKKMIAAYCAAGVIFTGLGATAIFQHNSSKTQVASKEASIERWKELNEQGQADFNAGKFAQAETIFSSELEMAKKLKNKQLCLASCNELLDLYNAQIVLQPNLANDQHFKESQAKIAQEVADLQNEELSDIANVKKELASLDSLSDKAKEEVFNNALDLGYALSERGRFEESIVFLKEVSKAVDKFGKKVLIGKAYFALGMAYLNNRDEKQAKASFRMSLQVREKVLSKDNFDIARSAAGLARVSEPKEAVALLESGREITARSHHLNSYQVGWADTMLAEQAEKNKDFSLVRQKAESAVVKCRNALETQLSIEEQNRAKQALVRALIYRARANRELLNAQSGHMPDKIARETVINSDFSTALKYVQELNPKPNAYEVDLLTGYLLGESANGLLRDYNVAVSKSEPIATDDSGHPLLLSKAKVQLARALAINERLPLSEKIRQDVTCYQTLGKVSRALLDFPFAERMYRQAKEMSERAFGTNDSLTAAIQQELDAVIRDSGQNRKK